jgi:magnesium-protoporphyrin O-methyltransferase
VPQCCRPGDFDDVFDEARAASDARTYGRRGLDREARAIVRTLREGGVTGWSVLEVGGGVGAIQVELLRAGAARATNVELSLGYENAARELLARSGLEGRVDRRIGDFVAEAPTLGTADAVVLHRVVCCYADVDALVGAAARAAAHELLVTAPVDRWWARAAGGVLNALFALRRSKFRFYVHPASAIRTAAEREGLRAVFREGRLVWQLLAFARQL